MSVTQQLLKLFQVDKQLRGLRSRLDAAERFVEQQTATSKELEERAASIAIQVKHLKASIANDEGEAARYGAKIDNLREQINSVKTAKEYTAGLAELNNYKELKTKHEDAAVESMAKLEQLEAQAVEIRGQRDERTKILAGAEADRSTREAEIKDRLEELKSQRAEVSQGIPKDALAILESLIKLRGDDAMAPVEVLDRRNLEYSCTGCMMTLPVETVSAMLAGKLTRCVSCSCIIFTEEEILPAKPAAKTKKSAKQVAKSS
ncbi:MAG: zinc ribbon domain-containing protein [Phycisphaerales bacterium]